jgi:hypothetical protein
MEINDAIRTVHTVRALMGRPRARRLDRVHELPLSTNVTMRPVSTRYM